MKRKLHKQNWAWEHFEKDGTKYLTNKTNWNAWCRGCLRFRSITLREEDEQLVLTGQIEAIRSEEDLFKQALADIYNQAICGKIPTLHTHLAGCSHVDPKVRHRAAHDRARPGRGIKIVNPSVSDAPSQPTCPGDQEWFETALCRTAASAGWSWNSLNDPEFKSMIKVLRPDLEVPDRRVLSGRVLDGEITRVVGSLKAQVEGRLVTGMCDGWKNVARTSVVACMITVDYQAHIINTHNVSASRKTADNLLALVLEELKYIETELGGTAVGWCSDASGESRSMRRKLHDLMPYLVVLDCYSHQVNLVVGDIFKRVPEMAQVAANANKIVKWFRNHSYALGLLRQCQQDEYGETLALILAVITRWTAHYCAAARLLEIVKALQVCVVRHEADMLDSAGPASSEGRKTGREVFKIIRNPEFWSRLLTMKIALEPLAIAANITQEANTRLDHVLVAMCSLFHRYNQQSDIPKEIRLVAQASLETRWAKADQDPFIAATYINPFYRHHLFNPNEPGLRPLGLYSILKRLFIRFFPEEQFLTGAFMQANEMYAAAKGTFSDENMYLEELAEQSNAKGGVTLLRIWGNLAVGPKSGKQQFAKLTHRLISIVPTSAGCERLFSNLGITHTKLRNRLTTTSARKIVQLKMDLRAGHVRDGLVPPRSTRQQIRSAAPQIPAEGDLEREDEELDDEEDEEVDTSAVIQRLIDDVDEDEDAPDENDVEMNQGGGEVADHNDGHALPRIVFRWTREFTLARIFDYASLSGDKPALSQARSAWVGGAANLKAEMDSYGLEAIFGNTGEEGLGSA